MPQDFEYFPLYVHRLLSSRDVRKMGATAFGGYMFLLIESFIFEPQGYLPDDDGELRDLARMSEKEWAKYGEKLTSKFKKRRGKLIYNPTLREIIRDLQDKRAKRASAGRIGASKRWDQGELPFAGDGNAIAKPSVCNDIKIEQNRRKQNRNKRTPRAVQYSLEFDSFWNAYPRGETRGAKSQAFRNWEALLGEGIPPSLLLGCCDNYAKTVEAKRTEPGFVIRPSNFLGRDRRFEEYTPENWTPPSKHPAWEKGMARASDYTNETTEEKTERRRKTDEHNKRVLGKLEEDRRKTGAAARGD